MLIAVLLGLMVHFLVFRPLRNAAPLGKVIGSVGVLTYLTGVMQLNFSSLNNPNPRTIVPEEPLDNFLWLGRSFARSSLYLAAIALLVGFGLWALYRYTRFGIATRAAAGNEKGAVLLGYSPEFLAAANWVIASVVAGFAAIIIGPFGGSLSPVQLTSLLGFFLAAMLIAKLSFAHDGDVRRPRPRHDLHLERQLADRPELVPAVDAQRREGGHPPRRHRDHPVHHGQAASRSEARSRRNVCPSLPIRSGWCPTPSSGAPW